MLINIYETPASIDILYQLLKERPPLASISHREMPTWEEHKRFVGSKPYAAWYLIVDRDDFVGAVYLTKADEIGIFVFEKYQGRGHARRAIRALMSAHPRDRYLANIAPGNDPSLNLFKKLGFTHIQETFEFSAELRKDTDDHQD